MNGKEQYLLTERAHLMCPQMNFGIVAKIISSFNEEKLYSVINKLEFALSPPAQGFYPDMLW